MPTSDGSAPGATSPLDRRVGVRRAGILAAIRDSRQGLGIRALAEETGAHENTVRFHLERLVAEGVVERRTGPADGPGRPPLVFVARRDHGVARRDHGVARRDNYELIARVLAGHLEGVAEDPVAAAEEAGRAWGLDLERALPVRGRDEALDELVRVLDGSGFAPELVAEPGGATLRAHHCPFGALAREDESVPCGVHLGLMRGVLEAAGGEVSVDRLEPFVSPSLCVAQLSG